MADHASEILKQMNIYRGSSPKFIDIRLMSSDGGTIPGHKIILCSVNWIVKNHPRINEDTIALNFTTEVLRNIVGYIYTGDLLPLTRDSRTALEYFRIAKEMRYFDLLDKISEKITTDFINSNNCVDIWRTTIRPETSGEERLLIYVEKFIFANLTSLPNHVNYDLNVTEIRKILNDRRMRLKALEVFDFIMIWWGKNKIERQMDGKSLIIEYVAFDEIEKVDFPLITNHPLVEAYLSREVMDIINKYRLLELELREVVLDWDSYPEN